MNGFFQCDAPVYSRREVLQAASSGFGYLAFLALAQGDGVSAASAAEPASSPDARRDLSARSPHGVARARRVILLTMRGGPSHIDLFDYKPDLIRHAGQSLDLGRDAQGARLLPPTHPFARHGESGLWISSLYPRIAGHADDLCLVNSLQTDLPNHAQAFGQMHTGSFQFVRPSLGAWTLYGLGSENENLPGFITLNPPADFGGAQNYGSAFLPAICQGTKLGGSQLPDLYAAFLGTDTEPGPPMKHIINEHLTASQQREQLDLIRGLNERKLERDRQQPEIDGAIESFELAFRMQARVPELLDLRGETEATRKLYGVGQGRDQFARQCLLARRLSEAGVRFVEVTAPVNWDHHQLLKPRISQACAATDQPIAALLTDLKARGLLAETLVIWAGEFGRTPYAQSGDGRDHNHRGYSLWMAGGGVKGGHRYGATDEIGHKAVTDPLSIADWHATILHLLGLDHTRLTFGYGGRQFRLTETRGRVAHGLIA